MISKIIKTDRIDDVLDYCKRLRNNNPKKEFILFLDIDDTVLSSSKNVRLVDSNIRNLISYVYDYNPNNLVFCTARNKDTAHVTQNQLCHSKLLHIGKRPYYNVLYSPYINVPFDIYSLTAVSIASLGEFVPTKGKTIMDYLNARFHTTMEKEKEQPLKESSIFNENTLEEPLYKEPMFKVEELKDYVILFVDDAHEQIHNVLEKLDKSSYSFKLFYYTAASSNTSKNWIQKIFS